MKKWEEEQKRKAHLRIINQAKTTVSKSHTNPHMCNHFITADNKFEFSKEDQID